MPNILAEPVTAEQEFPLNNPDLSTRRLRAWIRLLRISRSTENHLRNFLRTNYNTTLPRFDVLAALFRNEKPMKMSDLSHMLLVSNGNSTTVVDHLEKEGLVVRLLSAEDRRVVEVTLSKKGRKWFEEVAKGHEAEINKLFSTISADELDSVRDIMKKLEHR